MDEIGISKLSAQALRKIKNGGKVRLTGGDIKISVSKETANKLRKAFSKGKGSHHVFSEMEGGSIWDVFKKATNKVGKHFFKPAAGIAAAALATAAGQPHLAPAAAAAAYKAVEGGRRLFKGHSTKDITDDLGNLAKEHATQYAEQKAAPYVSKYHEYKNQANELVNQGNAYKNMAQSHYNQGMNQANAYKQSGMNQYNQGMNQANAYKQSGMNQYNQGMNQYQGMNYGNSFAASNPYNAGNPYAQFGMAQNPYRFGSQGGSLKGEIIASSKAPRSRNIGFDMLNPLADATHGHAVANSLKGKLESRMAAARQRTSTAGLIGVGGNLLHQVPPLQSQPDGSNFQFRHTLVSPAFHPSVFGN